MKNEQLNCQQRHAGGRSYLAPLMPGVILNAAGWRCQASHGKWANWAGVDALSMEIASQVKPRRGTRRLMEIGKLGETAPDVKGSRGQRRRARPAGLVGHVLRQDDLAPSRSWSTGTARRAGRAGKSPPAPATSTRSPTGPSSEPKRFVDPPSAEDPVEEKTILPSGSQAGSVSS